VEYPESSNDADWKFSMQVVAPQTGPSSVGGHAEMAAKASRSVKISEGRVPWQHEMN
jgi:hypothetical protein